MIVEGVDGPDDEEDEDEEDEDEDEEDDDEDEDEEDDEDEELEDGAGEPACPIVLSTAKEVIFGPTYIPLSATVPHLRKSPREVWC